MHDANRAIAKTEMLDPHFASVRQERLDPRTVKSRIVSAFPTREVPTTESAEERRAKDRNESCEPRCRKSMTLTLDPKREIP
jgi:hypothetical protein